MTMFHTIDIHVDTGFKLIIFPMHTTTGKSAESCFIIPNIFKTIKLYLLLQIIKSKQLQVKWISESITSIYRLRK